MSSGRRECFSEKIEDGSSSGGAAMVLSFDSVEFLSECSGGFYFFSSLKRDTLSLSLYSFLFSLVEKEDKET